MRFLAQQTMTSSFQSAKAVFEIQRLTGILSK